MKKKLNFKKQPKKIQSQHVLTYKTRDPSHEPVTNPVVGKP